MGTGIVSVAFAHGREQPIFYVLLTIAAFAWIALGLVLVRGILGDRRRLLAEARSPESLSGVAATAVLGTGVLELGGHMVGAMLLVLAALAWPVLTPAVLTRVGRHLTGEWFLVSVATEGVATLAASLATAEHADWLAALGMALAALGVLLYPLVLVRFDARELASGHGTHWVAGGSLAISALAFAQLALADRRLGAIPGAARSLEQIALVLWIGAMLWLPALLIAELRWPRPRYDLQRWSTVFPLGMYAVCSFAVASAEGTPWIADFARAWRWLALAAWTVTFAGLARTAFRHG